MIQLQGSPATPVNSHSSSVSDQSAPGLLSEESDSGAARGYYAGEKDLGNITELARSTCYSKSFRFSKVYMINIHCYILYS
jgi:hypothetical protein